MIATPPGVKRTWTDMLPAPWDQNPDVVVLMAPIEAVFTTRGTEDRRTVFGCFEFKGEFFGVQVLKPQMRSYDEHKRYFNMLGADMVVPAYRGRLSGIPQALLNSTDFTALALDADNMSGNYLDLRRAGKDMTLQGSQ